MKSCSTIGTIYSNNRIKFHWNRWNYMGVMTLFVAQLWDNPQSRRVVGTKFFITHYIRPTFLYNLLLVSGRYLIRPRSRYVYKFPWHSVSDGRSGRKLEQEVFRRHHSFSQKVIFWSSGNSNTMQTRFREPKNPYVPIFRPIGELIGDFDKQHLLRATLPNWKVGAKNSKCYNSKVV